jgi:hypothetical protein
VDQPVEEGAGGEHHGGRFEAQADLGDDAGDPVADHGEVVHGLLEQPQVGLVLEAAADRGLVEHPVGLGAGGTHGRALAGVEDAELDAAFVGGRRHGAAEGVHFLDQMPLADAADGRVAAHLAEGFDVVGEQQGGAPGPCRGQRGFGAGMAAADNDHVESGGMKHWETGEGESGEPNDTTLRCKNTALRTPVEAKINAFTTAYRIF